jgi:outer membrane lipoprotein-sorting protein
MDGRWVGVICGAILVVLVLQGELLQAQSYKGYQPVPDMDVFSETFARESARVMSIQSAFTQEKVLMALTEKITSEGNFWFKRSDKVKLEYTRPFRYLLIMNEGKLLVKDEKAESRVTMSSNKLFQQINRVIIDCVQGTVLSGKDFSVRVFEDPSSFLLEMIPNAKNMREIFQSVILVVEKADYSVRSIDMNEPTGDKTTIVFTDKQININIPDAVFSL